MIGFSKNEAKVFCSVTHNQQTVAQIVRKSTLPRMTVYTTLLRLEKKGLVKSAIPENKKRKVWFRNKSSFIEKELFKTRTFLFPEIKKETKNNDYSTEITIYRGKKEIKDTLMYLTIRKDGIRMYSIQNANNWKRWLDLMGKSWINEHNRAVVKHKLIAFTIHSPQAPEVIKKDEEIIDAYKGRLGNSHAIPEHFLKRDLSFYIFEDTIFLVNLEKLEGTLLVSEDMSSFLIKMFAFMFEKADEEEFFLKYNR